VRFEPNKPFETPKSAVVVDEGLPPGRHRFQLVVVNNAGAASKPVEVIVTVEPGRTVITPDRITNPGTIGVVGPSRPIPP
jgi:hypothetical protein